MRARLRRLIVEMEQRSPSREAPPVRTRDVDEFDGDVPRDLMATAERRETELGPFTYREVTYPLEHVAGHQRLGDITALSPETLRLLAPEEGIEDAAIGDLYFLDIETTGLGGAGAIAFLVAAGRFDVDDEGAPTAFVLSQYLAESPPEEAALLEALIEDARFRDEPVLVTYNGGTFDAPMLDGRATMHRKRGGFEGLRQLDLLRPARTSYRGLLRNCKLATMEHELLGMTRPSEDVPGAEVPHWYFRFLRTGDHRMLNPIVEHNELDIVGMVGLLAWHVMHLDGGREPSERDALAVGRLLVARGDDERAAPFLERAVAEAEGGTSEAGATADESRTDETIAAGRRASALRARTGRTVYRPGVHRHVQPGPPSVREEALLRLAALRKRAGARELAAQLWHQALDLPARAPLEPLIELAMYYEHQCKDFDRAIAHADQAAAHVATQVRPHDPRRGGRWLEAIEHRLARLHSRAERARRTT